MKATEIGDCTSAKEKALPGRGGQMWVLVPSGAISGAKEFGGLGCVM